MEDTVAYHVEVGASLGQSLASRVLSYVTPANNGLQNASGDENMM